MLKNKPVLTKQTTLNFKPLSLDLQSLSPTATPLTPSPTRSVTKPNQPLSKPALPARSSFYSAMPSPDSTPPPPVILISDSEDETSLSKISTCHNMSVAQKETLTIEENVHPVVSAVPAKRKIPWTTGAEAIEKSINEREVSDDGTEKPKVVLSEEQMAVLKMVVEQGESLFFTGAAGTGKSILLREIIKAFKQKYSSEQIAITASTGIAACNIGGCTLHSFAGIGLGKGKISELVGKIRKSIRSRNRWTQTRVLIIDEISMVDGDLFTKLEAIAQSVRGNPRDFGGIQVIVTGDFFQLPPVSDRNSVAKFAFESTAWPRVISKTIFLKKVWRQADHTFVSILNEARLGKLSPRSLALFKSLSREPNYGDKSIEPTQLFALRNQVDPANDGRLMRLPGELHNYPSQDSGDMDKINQSCIAPRNLQLKIGAQVMLLKNKDEMLVNGSLGVVIGFVGENKLEGVENLNAIRNEQPREEKALKKVETSASMEIPYPIVKFANGRKAIVTPEEWKIEMPGGEIIASRFQIPLILAWALSIHKSQGQTLDCVKVDLGKVFECGQAYVALSRATSLESLQVLNFDGNKVKAHPKVINFYNQIEQKQA